MDIWETIGNVIYYVSKGKKYLVWGILIVGVPLGVGFILMGGDAMFDLYCAPINYPVSGKVTPDCGITTRDGIARRFTDKVKLSCTDLPRGVTCEWKKTEVGVPYGPVDLQINISPGASKGNQRIIVHAESRSLKRDAWLDLDIQ